MTHLFSVFSQCGCHREALDAFEKASCWQQVFVASSLLGHTVPERMELARRVGSKVHLDTGIKMS